MSLPTPNPQPDTSEARQYNGIKRWMQGADLSIGDAFLAVLLLTGWNRSLRDVSIKMAGDHYVLQLFFYVLLLSVISKVLGLGIDFYSFHLEHRFNLSNQRLGGWIKDEIKGWVLGLVLGAGIAEIIYALIRTSPAHWWIIAWLVFFALIVFFVQIAPVV